MERQILEAVARADLFICYALRGLVVVTALGLILLGAVIGVRAWAYRYCDPYRIDYDAPGADITSDGPEMYVGGEEW